MHQVVRNAAAALAEQVGTTCDDVLDAVEMVAANNHHFRIRAYERRLRWLAALQYAPQDALDAHNLLCAGAGDFEGREENEYRNTVMAEENDGAEKDRQGWRLFAKPPTTSVAPAGERAIPRKVEVSHHLAHAFSAAHGAPFDEGLVVVMDGMGDSLDDWLRSHDDASHFCELSAPPALCQDASNFEEWPRDVSARPGATFREAETAYVFRRGTDGSVSLRRVFKRWSAENEPSELPNHSFEEMDSVGAMYSRVSAIIFNDWNACGKVSALDAVHAVPIVSQ